MTSNLSVQTVVVLVSIIDTTALLLYYSYIRIAEQQLGQLTEINDDWLKTGAVETLINDDINTLLNTHMISYAGFVFQ